MFVRSFTVSAVAFGMTSGAVVTPAPSAIILTLTKLDPCKTLCSASKVTDCSSVKAVGTDCANLYYDDKQVVLMSSVDRDDLRKVTADSAFESVSTKAESCAELCNKTGGCSGSFCKPNNHCKGLYWSDLSAGTVCFPTPANLCQVDSPVHCDVHGNFRAKTEAPATGAPDTETPARATITASESPSGDETGSSSEAPADSTDSDITTSWSTNQVNMTSLPSNSSDSGNLSGNGSRIIDGLDKSVASKSSHTWHMRMSVFVGAMLGLYMMH